MCSDVCMARVMLALSWSWNLLVGWNQAGTDWHVAQGHGKDTVCDGFRCVRTCQQGPVAVENGQPKCISRKEYSSCAFQAGQPCGHQSTLKYNKRLTNIISCPQNSPMQGWGYSGLLSSKQWFRDPGSFHPVAWLPSTCAFPGTRTRKGTEGCAVQTWKQHTLFLPMFHWLKLSHVALTPLKRRSGNAIFLCI